MRRAAALVALALLAAGCGGGGTSPKVLAAASLTEAFQKLDSRASYDFGGSDELTLQLEQGDRADVFASASPKYTDELRAKGLIERPHVFASNRLVLIEPAGRQPTLNDLLDPKIKLVLAAKGVPAGDYGRTAIAAFCRSVYIISPACPRARIVSEEPDVKGVVAKVVLGEADAGIVYATDAKAAGSKVHTQPIPSWLQPKVSYTIAVVHGARHRAAAERFVRLVLGNKGQSVLRRQGFGPP